MYTRRQAGGELVRYVAGSTIILLCFHYLSVSSNYRTVFHPCAFDIADSFTVLEEEMLLDLEGGLGPFGAMDSTTKIMKKEGTKLVRRTSKGEFMI